MTANPPAPQSALREAMKEILTAYMQWNALVHASGDLCEFITFEMITKARAALSAPEAQQGEGWGADVGKEVLPPYRTPREQELENALWEAWAWVSGSPVSPKQSAYELNNIIAALLAGSKP